MQLTYFGGLPLPMGDEEVAFPFETRSNLLELADGSFDQLGSTLQLRPYVITRGFKLTDLLQCSAQLGFKLDDLMRVFASGRRVLRATWRDGSQRQTYAKVSSALRTRRIDDRSYQELAVTFVIDFPYWFKTAHEPRHFDHGYYFDAGWSFDGNYTTQLIDSTRETFTITNNGIVPIKRGKLIVRPRSGGSLTDLTITNETNWLRIFYFGTLAYPQVLTLDLLSKSAKVDSVNAYANIELPSGQMLWMRLELGANTIALEPRVRAGNVDFEWHWADTYV